MSKVEYEGRLDYSKFDKMDTDILEALLRANFDAPEAEQMEPEAALYILNLLSERQEDETSPTATDIAVKKVEFDEKYYPMLENEQLLQEFLEDMEYVEDSQDNVIVVKPWIKHWRRFASVAAVLVIFMFGGTLTAYALGYNPIAAIGRWSKDFFWFEEPSVTSELSDKLAEYGYPENTVPKWLPDAYVLESINVNEYEDYIKVIDATFLKQTNDDIDTLIISYKIYLGDNKKALYNKDNGDVVRYEIKDRVYYVMTNLDDRVIAWQNGDFEGAIMGKITIEEAEKIIKSIGGE